MKTLLVSHCLFGENVRYDGGNCKVRADYIARLKNHYKLIFICPEVMAGLSVPRDPIERLGSKIVDQQGMDLTEKFDDVLLKIQELVKSNGIEFALLKEFSPSCAPAKIYDGTFSGNIQPGLGIVAQALQELGLRLYSEESIEELLRNE